MCQQASGERPHQARSMDNLGQELDRCKQRQCLDYSRDSRQHKRNLQDSLGDQSEKDDGPRYRKRPVHLPVAKLEPISRKPSVR